MGLAGDQLGARYGVDNELFIYAHSTGAHLLHPDPRLVHREQVPHQLAEIDPARRRVVEDEFVAVELVLGVDLRGANSTDRQAGTTSTVRDCTTHDA